MVQTDTRVSKDEATGHTIAASWLETPRKGVAPHHEGFMASHPTRQPTSWTKL
jgi:hypothetical protein